MGLEFGFVKTSDFRDQIKKCIVAARRSLALAFFVRDFNAHEAGKTLDRLDEFHVVILHQEVERIAMLSAAKTMVETFARTDGERRRLLIMERAASFKFLARFFELNPAADNLNDIGPVDQVNNELLWYETAHSVSNGYVACSGLLDAMQVKQSLLFLFLATRSELKA